MAIRRIFWGFCRNWFLIDPLHYLLSRFDFGFEFPEIFVIENDSRTRRVGELVTLRLTESGSRWLTESASRGVDVSPSRRVGFRMFKWKFGESESRRLPDSASRKVANSPTRRVKESSTPRLAELGIRYGELWNRYSNFFKFFITWNS